MTRTGPEVRTRRDSRRDGTLEIGELFVYEQNKPDEPDLRWLGSMPSLYCRMIPGFTAFAPKS